MTSNDPRPLLDSYEPRDDRPDSPARLRRWVRAYTGVEIEDKPVCAGHQAPWDYFSKLYFDRPPLTLVLGPRGGREVVPVGVEHARDQPVEPSTRDEDPGRSRCQSDQVYRALRETVYQGQGPVGSDAESIAQLLKGEATYGNGSEVSSWRRRARASVGLTCRR